MRLAVWIFIFSSLCGGVLFGAEPNPTPAPYRFSGGETIMITLPQRDHQGYRQVVPNDGTVSVPTGGVVNLLGKTIGEAQQLVREKMEKESGERKLIATVMLESVPTKKAFFSGEVKATQALDLPSGKPLNLLQALTLVGGATEFADLSRVNIIRAAQGAERKSIEIDCSRLGLPGNTDLGPTLEPDDVIIVPRGDVFVLSGEFARQGPISRRELLLNRGEPARVSRLLFIVGGLKASANRRTMRVIRTNKTGEKEVIPVDLDAATGVPSKNDGPKSGDVIRDEEKPAVETKERPGRPTPPRVERPTEKADPKAAQPADEPEDSEAAEAPAPAVTSDADIVLQDGDVLTVAGSGGVIILGKVKAPGLYALPSPTLKLSRLVAMAGGFSEFAKGSSVTVIRSGPPKKVLTVDVNAIVKDGHLEKDVELEDGDYVFVGERVL